MAFNKKSEFEEQEILLADLAKALAHPARIAILKELANRGTCICGEIVEVLPLSQSTVSQHLKELKNAGLIQGTIEGPRSCYCLDKEKLEQLENLFGTLLNSLKQDPKTKNCC